MFNLKNATFNYLPYPVCYIKDIFSISLYDQLIDTFPKIDDMNSVPHMGQGKYLLREKDDLYCSIIKKNLEWNNLYNFIKSQNFIHTVLNFLKENNIDLGLENKKIIQNSCFENDLIKNDTVYLSSMFEFSNFIGKNGSHLPHTDHPKKVVSIIIPLIKENEWEEDWGGGTSICQPKDPSKNYNYMNSYLDFSEINILKTYPFKRNSAILFVKTFNSWHTVLPYTLIDSVSRRSIVINIKYND